MLQWSFQEDKWLIPWIQNKNPNLSSETQINTQFEISDKNQDLQEENILRFKLINLLKNLQIKLLIMKLEFKMILKLKSQHQSIECQWRREKTSVLKLKISTFSTSIFQLNQFSKSFVAKHLNILEWRSLKKKKFEWWENSKLIMKNFDKKKSKRQINLRILNWERNKRSIERKLKWNSRKKRRSMLIRSLNQDR